MKTIDYTRVYSIYGTRDWWVDIPSGYRVDDLVYNRTVGYVAKRGRRWAAYRPKRFDFSFGFHKACREYFHRSSVFTYATRADAARSLIDLADKLARERQEGS